MASASPSNPTTLSAPPALPATIALLPLLFAITLFLSALLLFLVQPLIGRMVLPLLGGSPGVWTTCMVFFQAVLLAGYLYAHASTTWLSPRRQLVLHAVLLLLPFAVLPLAVGPLWQPSGGQNPVPWLLGLLLVCVGLPFFVLATSAPLLQKWFAGSGHPSASDPYFLYAASNLGSLAALLSYPVLLEPYLRLGAQSWGWTVGYALLVVLILACGLLLWRNVERGTRSVERSTVKPPSRKQRESATPRTPPPPPHPLPWRLWLRWIVRAFVPSSLLLGLTTYLTTDVAAIPLLWIIPLTLYLLSFVLAFSRLPAEVKPALGYALPPLILAQVFLMVSEFKLLLPLLLALHMTTFFAVAWYCHLDLAQSRPPAEQLTGFYLCLSLGGVLGGLFNALVAPAVFRSLLEYPLVLGLACLLLPSWAVEGGSRVGRWFDAVIAFVVGGTAIGFLIRGAYRLSEEMATAPSAGRPMAKAPPGGGLGAVLNEFFGSLTRWIDKDLFDLQDLSATLNESTGRIAGALLILTALAALVYAFRRRSGWLGRLLDVVVPLSLGVVASGLIIISALSGKAMGMGTETATDKLLTYGPPVVLCLALVRRPVRFGLGVLALFLAVSYCERLPENVLHRERSFFGVLSVERRGNAIRLMHGTTLHGTQNFDFGPHEPLTYYHREGPIGQVFAVYNQGRPRVAVVGLGTGSLACYAERGQTMTFYEIDPAIERIASNPHYFTFLFTARRHGAQVKVVLGDARLKLAEAKDETYDLLIVDAFSSDAIPVHLLTRQAMRTYLDRCSEQGLIAFHISNRHIDLEPVLAALARDAGLTGVVQSDSDDDDIGKTGSDWVVLARQPADLEPLLGQFPDRWRPLSDARAIPVWTDDFSNLLRVFLWR